LEEKVENKKYILRVYNTATGKEEHIEVTEEVYNAYRRTGWNIERNDRIYFRHEIQFSGLIGGEDGNYENFREFCSMDENPENIVLDRQKIIKVAEALSKLTEKERSLLYSLYFEDQTERAYAKEHSISQTTVHKKKVRILRKMKNFLRK
jgi:RNA polymerase sigma factor (sigma-70 family)